ncbi:hypothetical protein BJY04DRAFT_204166 [Aspergillus karnatakaensis]|uniref:uncharacterized protein n=1 Tax=Aspergillus karnatakaensis TaxID=1810916 RepID=UPI003CCE35FE
MRGTDSAKQVLKGRKTSIYSRFNATQYISNTINPLGAWHGMNEGGLYTISCVIISHRRGCNQRTNLLIYICAASCLIYDFGPRTF